MLCPRLFDQPAAFRIRSARARAMHAARVTRQAGQDNCRREEEVSHLQPSIEGRLSIIMVLRQTHSVVSQPSRQIGVTLFPCAAIFQVARYFEARKKATPSMAKTHLSMHDLRRAP